MLPYIRRFSNLPISRFSGYYSERFPRWRIATSFSVRQIIGSTVSTFHFFRSVRQKSFLRLALYGNWSFLKWTPSLLSTQPEVFVISCQYRSALPMKELSILVLLITCIGSFILDKDGDDFSTSPSTSFF